MNGIMEAADLNKAVNKESMFRPRGPLKRLLRVDSSTSQETVDVSVYRDYESYCSALREHSACDKDV